MADPLSNPRFSGIFRSLIAYLFVFYHIPLFLLLLSAPDSAAASTFSGLLSSSLFFGLNICVFSLFEVDISIMNWWFENLVELKILKVRGVICVERSWEMKLWRGFMSLGRYSKPYVCFWIFVHRFSSSPFGDLNYCSVNSCLWLYSGIHMAEIVFYSLPFDAGFCQIVAAFDSGIFFTCSIWSLVQVAYSIFWFFFIFCCIF